MLKKLVLFCVLLLAFAGSVSAETITEALEDPSQPLAVFVVNSTGDQSDANPGNGSCATAAGACTLRAAIEETNALPGYDQIRFNIPGGGFKVIRPQTELPAVTDRVFINGTTQAGSSCASQEQQALLRVVLEGSLVATANADGLRLDSGSDRSIIAGLVIGNFDGAGIEIRLSSRNIIGCNFIGVHPNGDDPLPNGLGVYVLFGNENRIGFHTTEARNVISGNSVYGVSLYSTDENIVQNNYIGTNARGTQPLPNGQFGVVVGNNTSGNVVGTNTSGYGMPNIIAFNGEAGVRIGGSLDTTEKATVRRNAIFDNGLLGIDLGLAQDGVTFNDAGDADTGPNSLQNYPDLVTAEASTNEVKGALVSTPNTSFLIDAYRNQQCDPSGYGEGQQYLGTFVVTTNGAGVATFTNTVGAFSVGDEITMTATNPSGETSEFSACLTAANN